VAGKGALMSDSKYLRDFFEGQHQKWKKKTSDIFHSICNGKKMESFTEKKSERIEGEESPVPPSKNDTGTR